MELKQALRTALDFEKKGHCIYMKAAKNTGNNKVAEVFSYLAGQELHHIDEIKKYIKRLGNGHKVNLEGDRPAGTKKFFLSTFKAFKEETELSQDDIKSYETALGLEQSSYDFYKEQHDKTKDKEAKTFFNWVMSQENAHYILVQKAYEYIRNPIAFYREQEKWVVEG